MQGAYDSQKPNGTSKYTPGNRVVLVFRLYRRRFPIMPFTPTSGLADILKPVTDTIQAVRRVARGISEFLSPLDEFVLDREYKFVMLLDRIEQSTELRTALNYTRGGYFIDTVFRRAKGFTNFRISGTTHWTPVYVNGVQVDGDAAIKDFCELIDDYFSPPASTRLRTADYRLYFLNLQAPISAEDPFGEFEWLIHPRTTGPRVRRDKQRPFLRTFDFDFVGLESNRDRAKAEDGFMAGLLSKGLLAKLLDLIPGGAKLGSILSDIFGVIDQFQGMIADIENVVSAVTDFVRGVQAAIQATIAKVRAVLNAIQSVIGQVENGIEIIRRLPDVVSDDLQLLRSSLPGLHGPDDEANAAASCEQLRRIQTLMLAVAAQPQNLASAPEGAGEQTVAAKVPPGATIERLAQMHGVAAETLIAVNRLKYPFVSPTPSERAQLTAAVEAVISGAGATAVAGAGVSGTMTTAAAAARYGVNPAVLADVTALPSLAERTAAIATRTSAPTENVIYPGDSIRIPNQTTAVPPSVVAISAELASRIESVTGSPVTEEDRLFGLDLALTEDGDLVWDEDRRDFILERAVPHMANVQLRYVRLPLGELRFAPGLGNFAFENRGNWQGPASNQLLAYAITRTLQQDPRVKQIRNARAETYAGVAVLTHDVDLINGSTVPELRVPIP